MRTIHHPIRELFVALAGCVAVVLLLDSAGLAHWANRLQPGEVRSAAVPVTATVEKMLRPLGIDVLRTEALQSLARVGWSDDAALLASVSPISPSGGGASNAVCSAAGTTGAHAIKPVSVSKNDFPNAVGGQAPLASTVPRVTALTPLPPVTAGKPRVVALAGDSMMAVGLSATLMRQAATDRNLRIVKAFRSGTGLARPEVFNWMDEYPAMLGAEKPDVVVVAIGANDAQGFVMDGKVFVYGTPEWEKIYQQRVASYLAMVGAGGARVVWMGLPPMRVSAYDEKIANLNRIAYSVVSQSPRAIWWNPVPYVGDETGRYREFAALGNGHTLRLRAADGIHLSDEGAGLLTAVLLSWLDPPVAKAEAVLPPAGANASSASSETRLAPLPEPARSRRRGRRVARG